jgi:hypothetical protein
MAKEIYKSGNYIVTVDADNNSRLFPIGKTVYDEYNSVFRLTEGLIEDDQLVISYADSSNWVDDSAVSYTEATLRTFLRENTGFSPASGGSGAAWGGITGTLSTQTDLQSELDDKQDTLVSATNIKTINGNSVLGSGDLAISGGGGAPATQILIEPKSNSFYGIGINGNSASNLTNLNSGQLLLTAFRPAYDLQINAISFVTVQTALAGGLLKVVIYSDANGQPNTKLFESATVSADTTGNKLLTGLSFTFNANETYWISTVSNGNIQVRAYDTSQQYPLFPIIANSNTTQKYQSYRYNSNFNSLPSTMPNLTSSTYSSSRVAMITLRKS